MKKLTLEEFIEKSIAVHGDIYDYSKVNYNGNREKVRILCTKHGEFLQKAGRHLYGDGCNSCGIESRSDKRRFSTDTFIKMSKKIHGNTYNYSLSKYINSCTKVDIVCAKHGIFKQSPNHHLNRHGCPDCGKEYIRESPPGWSLASWKIAADSSEYFDSFKVYIIECWNDEERFYKIGRTFTTVGRRFIWGFPYRWKLVEQVEGDAESVFTLEGNLQSMHKSFKYTPKNKFSGMHECFSKININGKKD